MSAYCRITSQEWIVNGISLLKNEENLPTNIWLKSIYQKLKLSYPKFYKMDLLSKSTFLGVESISETENITQQNIPLLFANSVGSFVADEMHAASLYLAEEKQPSPSIFVYTLPNIAMGEVSIRHQLHSKNVFFIFDSFKEVDWQQIIDLNFQDIEVNKILFGWTEAESDNLDIWISLISREDWKDITLRSNITNTYF